MRSHRHLGLRALIQLLLFLMAIAAPFARNTSASASVSNTVVVSIEHCISPDSPNNNSPKDAFGRPTVCVSGKPIMYLPSENPVGPALMAVLNGGGPGDSNWIQSDYFGNAVQLDGQPDWGWVGSVDTFTNGDIAEIVSQTTNAEMVWGESRVKVLRVTFQGGVQKVTSIFEGVIDGRNIGDLVVADINGDGFDDMAVIPSDDSTNNVIGKRGLVNIFWGKDANHATFDRVSFEADDTPDAAALLSISGGRNSLGVMNWNSNVFQTWSATANTRNFSKSTFVGPTNQAGWDNVFTGDINNDRNDDFIGLIGQWNQNPYFRTFRGDGSGNFTEGQKVYPSTQATYENPSVGAVIDPNHDGKGDVAVLTLGNYQPDLSQWGSRLKIYNQIAALANGDTISVVPSIQAAGNIPSSLNSGRITCGDAIDDLDVESAGWLGSMIFVGLPQGGFDTVMREEKHGIYVNGARPHIAMLYDFNRDGLPDRLFSADYYGLRMELHRPCADITKAAPLKVNLGDSFTYSMTVSNTGLYPILGMMVSDQLPSTVVNATSTDGTIINGLFTSASFDLAVGGSKTVAVTVTATTLGFLYNQAEACEKGACTGLSNQTVTQVVAPPVGNPYKASFVPAEYWEPMGRLITTTMTLDRIPTVKVDVPVSAFPGTADINSNRIGIGTAHFAVGQQTTQVVVDVGADRSPDVTVRIDILGDQSVVTYGLPWQALVHRSAVEQGVGGYHVYLPLVVRSFQPIKINDAVARTSVVGYPWLPAGSSIYIDKTLTVVVPMDGKLHISGSPGGLNPLTYDDVFDVYVSGVLFKSVPCTRADKPYGCEAIQLDLSPGAIVTLRFVARDTDGSVIEAFEGWLTQ